MNYIAHIHIANHTQTSLLGNFLGDFVKGQSLEVLSPDLAIGVRLHRKVDQFTDSHELVKNLRRTFPKDIRRVAGIVIDITFDYFLLKQWDSLTVTSKEQVLAHFYHQLDGFEGIDSAYFTGLSQSLLTDRWLIKYLEPLTCLRALQSIERRLNNKIVFAQSAYTFFLTHQAVFEATFLAFYPELLNHAVQWSHKLRSV